MIKNFVKTDLTKENNETNWSVNELDSINVNSGKLNYIHSEVIKRLGFDLQNKLESAIIEGLKRKGFRFKDQIELENFIKTRCKVNDCIHHKQIIYYFDDTPFFLHNYEIITEPMSIFEQGVKMTSNYGTFAFL